MLLELVAGVLGFALASLLLPLVIRWAVERSVLDIPDDVRHRHSAPTPRVGGIAVFVAVILAALAALWWNPSALGAHTAPFWPGVLLGATIVFVTGLVDDIRGVVPTIKLIGHATAAFVVIASGFHFDTIAVVGPISFTLGYAAIPLTVLWIVGITNAFNLIDGVDGLAATFALIGLVAAVIVDLMVKPAHSLVVATATLGAMFAFLRYNRPPARVFLGDSGSTTLGFFLSIQLIISATDAAHGTYALVPLFALAYPITDTAVAIARRWLRGHPFSRADGRHIHHQLLTIGLSQRRTVGVLGLVFASAAVMGISVTFAPPRVVLALASGGTILLFTIVVYGIRWLGYHEFSAFASSVVSVVRNARCHVRNKIRASDLAAQLARAQSLDELKLMLGAGAEDLGFHEIALETNPGPYIGPSSRHISPKQNRPLHISCPIAWEAPDGTVGEATIRFWCERPNAYTHLGVERLVMHLAPAVQHWFESNRVAVAMRAERRHELQLRPHSGIDRRKVAAFGKR